MVKARHSRSARAVHTHMAYFVTGATGFIGRYLVQELIDNREGEIFVLCREGSRPGSRP